MNSLNISKSQIRSEHCIDESWMRDWKKITFISQSSRLFVIAILKHRNARVPKSNFNRICHTFSGHGEFVTKNLSKTSSCKKKLTFQLHPIRNREKMRNLRQKIPQISTNAFLQDSSKKIK